MKPAAFLTGALAAAGAVLFLASGGSSDGAIRVAALPPPLFVDGGSPACEDVRLPRVVRSPERPWCSLARAVAAAPAGRTVVVRGGRYPALEAVNIPARRRYVTLRPFKSERVTVAGFTAENAAFVRVRGFTISGPVKIDHGSHHIGILNNRIAPQGLTPEGNQPNGIVVEDGTYGIGIRGNRLTVPTGSGVHFSSGYSEPPIRNVSIRDNHFRNIGVVGVNARNFRNVVIDDNEFQQVHSWDGKVHPDVIRTYHGGGGLRIRRNFLHDNHAQGIFFKDGRVHGVRIENNVIARTREFKAINIYDVTGLRLVNNTIVGSTVFQGNATGVVLKNNIFTSLDRTGSVDLREGDHNYIGGGNFTTGGRHDLHRGLRFMNPDRLDFRLARGSAGIDAGTSRNAPRRDLRGRRRIDDPGVRNRGTGRISYQDIGALERHPADRPGKKGKRKKGAKRRPAAKRGRPGGS